MVSPTWATLSLGCFLLGEEDAPRCVWDPRLVHSGAALREELGGPCAGGSRSLGLASPSLIHPFTPSLIYSLSRCWPRPGFWDTTHRASCSNVLWSSCGPLTVAFEELCGLPHAPVPQGFPWSPLSSWASAVPTVRNAHQAHFPAHILPSPPGPASAVFQEALPHSQGGPPSLSRSTLGSGRSLI